MTSLIIALNTQTANMTHERRDGQGHGSNELAQFPRRWATQSTRQSDHRFAVCLRARGVSGQYPLVSLRRDDDGGGNLTASSSTMTSPYEQHTEVSVIRQCYRVLEAAILQKPP
jgi:hypothetical protein